MLCPLAYGGMASVWLARFGGRRGFERLVVVKMILPQYASDPRFQEMFVDEARIASRIEHGNVARILDVGEQDENSTYIVMEWVDGDSLSKVVRAAEQKKQRVPAGIALRICADAAAGLHAAHVLQERDGTHLGVVHRDVSPQNILVSNAGTTVIIDFGVAKARDRVSQDTSAGQLKGKIRYMAPEQALGRDLDHRADVWALGAILYELFAGVSPYDGPNEVATLHKLTSGAPPAPLPSYVPDPVRAVVERALAYDPEHRYATCLELNLALESAMIELGEPTSVAVVAHYTGQLLADRKLARKRAVDSALAEAHARDAGRSSMPVSIGTPAMATSQPREATAAVTSTARFLTAPTYSPELPSAPGASAPSGSLAPSTQGSTSYGPPGPMGYGESPSAASSATLGSAAMEYHPDPGGDPFGQDRRRRFTTAAVLAISVVAGLIGAILIISTAVMRRDAKPSSGVGTPTELAEPEAVPTGAPLAAPEAPSPVVTAPATPAAPSASSAPTTTAVTAAAPQPPAAAAGPANNHRPPSPVITPARPRPPQPPPAPVAAPPANAAKPDRGF
ncbi:MAG TPA: serine/threonine-protein kinase [Labilithrix sp.]|nr:serine/threonine-protein kinase [Labilithrix sp.]